jgi:hypothetical protein
MFSMLSQTKLAGLADCSNQEQPGAARDRFDKLGNLVMLFNFNLLSNYWECFLRTFNTHSVASVGYSNVL